MGSIVGPALVVVVADFLTPQSVFATSLVLMLVSTLLALVVLREPSRGAEETNDSAWEISSKRVIAAQASLRGIVLSAITARQLRGDSS